MSLNKFNKVKSIESYDLVFENCDVIRIYPDEVDKCIFSGIILTDIEKEDYCLKDFYGEIDKLQLLINENRDYIPFEKIGKISSKYFDNNKMSIFYRISWNDITDIYVNYLNGTVEKYYVNWSGDDYNFNSNPSQKTEIIDGRLHISIDENNNKINE